MVVLHFASISNNRSSGVDVVVPRHVAEQAKFADTALYNVKNGTIEGFDIQSKRVAPFSLDLLPAPYNCPDIVIFHEIFRPQYLLISKELKKKRIPYIVFPHGCLTSGALREKYLKKKIAMALVFNRFIKNSVAIQCLSTYEFNNTLFNCPKFIGTNGFDIAQENTQNGDKVKSFVYIGRIDISHKGIDLLINAIEIAKKELEKHNIMVHLYGPSEKSVEKKILRIIKKK